MTKLELIQAITEHLLDDANLDPALFELKMRNLLQLRLQKLTNVALKRILGEFQ